MELSTGSGNSSTKGCYHALTASVSRSYAQRDRLSSSYNLWCEMFAPQIVHTKSLKIHELHRTTKGYIYSIVSIEEFLAFCAYTFFDSLLLFQDIQFRKGDGLFDGVGLEDLSTEGDHHQRPSLFH
jgi:hypothetical protein